MKARALAAMYIGDIHFGAFEAEVLYKELKKTFFKAIKQAPKLDVIFICGDLFDHILSMNTDPAYYLLKFWSKLKELCNKRGAKIRVIRGTKGHDHQQLDILPIYEDEDIRIFNSVESEELFPGYKVLYLPEEYVKDPNEYYKDFYEDSYQLIIGHGQFEETAFNNYDSEINMESCPTFDAKKLISICDGPVVFGHIHVAVRILDHVWYTGSFSRWKMGEESPKGFLYSITDLNNPTSYKMYPIINRLARKHCTINITDIVKEHDVQDIINFIETYYEDENIYKLRCKINLGNLEEKLSTVAMIQNYFFSNKFITIDNVDSISKNEIEEEEGEQLIERYDYLFVDGPVENKISRFISENYSYNLPPEQIPLLLSPDIISKLDDILTEYKE